MGSVLLLATALAAQTPTPGWDAPEFRGRLGSFIHISVRRSFEAFTTRISVATDRPYEWPDEGARYWFRREVAQDGLPATHSYTDTNACPAARPILVQVEQLTMPQPDVPGSGREMEVIPVDGTEYMLEGRALHADGQPADFRIDSNNGTPTARWVDALLRVLELCWRPTPNPPDPAAD